MISEPNLFIPPSGAWLYVMMTGASYERFKVGKTINDPLDRAATLSTADPFLALEGAFFIPELMGNISAIETYVKSDFMRRGLGINRYSENPSEWFVGSGAWALEEIDKLLRDYTGQNSIGFGYEIHQDRITLLFAEALSRMFNRSQW